MELCVTYPDLVLNDHFTRLEGAYAPSTMRAYRADVEIFIDWCEVNGRQALPASPDTVCAFLEANALHAGPSTVRRRVYAIRKLHRLLKLPDPTYDEDVNLSLRRVRRSKLGRPKQAKGMTQEYLERFIAVQPDDIWGIRNRALLSLGYDLLTRRSELVALRSEDVIWRRDGTLRVIIRRSKADPFGEGRIAFTSRRSADFLNEWLEIRGSEITPLFCAIYQQRPIDRGISPSLVKEIIKAAAKASGLDRSVVRDFSGHSMRVGAAQDLLRAGHDTAAIMRAGGWKSINVLARYLEQAEHNVWEDRPAI